MGKWKVGEMEKFIRGLQDSLSEEESKYNQARQDIKSLEAINMELEKEVVGLKSTSSSSSSA